MDQFNKAISFILGLVVVAVFIAVASGRINLTGKLPFSSKSTLTPTPTIKTEQKQTSLFGNLFNFNKPTITPKVTPTPTVYHKPIPTITVIGNNNGSTHTYNSIEYHTYANVQNVSSIPDTGPVLLLPLIFSSLLGGIYLRKRSND